MAVIGATIYVLLDAYSGGVAAFACLASVIVLRFVTLRWNLRTRSVRPLRPSEEGRAPEGSAPEAD